MTDDNEVLFDANIVDDELMAFFSRFDANMDRMANAAEQGFSDVDQAMDRTSKKAGFVAGAVAAVTSKLIELGLQGVGALKQFVSSSVDLAAEVDLLGVSLEVVAKNAGYSSEEMRETEEEVKALGITTSKARQSMIRLTRANIDWSEAAKLARISQDAAVVAGINSSEAFERMVLGIQKQEPELLDELGITLNRTAAYDQLARSLGKTTKSLTDMEKQQAILNDIYRQSGQVADAYTTSLGTVGKQITSMPRLFEELQLSIGHAFQPALQAKISFMSDLLKDIQKWVDANEESINEFARILGLMAEGLFKLLRNVLDFLAKIPSVVQDASDKIQIAVQNIGDKSGSEKATQSIVTIWKKAFTLITAGAIAVGAQVATAFELMAASAVHQWNRVFHRDRLDESLANFERVSDKMGTVFKDTYLEWFDRIATGYGLIGDSASDAADELEEWEAAADDAALEAAQLEAAIEAVDEAFKELREDLAEKAELKALRETRKQIERALQESFRREDIERNFQERIRQIQEDAGDRSLANFEDWLDARANAALNNSKKLVKIEEQYRDRLKEIERDFAAEATELARKRDAVGLLALERKKNRELEKVKEQRDKEKTAQESSYAEQLANLKAQYDKFEEELIISTQEQFDRAEEARTKEYESLERSLDRQRQIRELHAKWQEEDEAKALEDRLTKMGENFAAIEGLTATHLANLLQQYEEFNTSAVMSGFLSKTGGMIRGRGRGPVSRSVGRRPTRGGGGRRRSPGGGGTPIQPSGQLHTSNTQYQQQQQQYQSAPGGTGLAQHLQELSHSQLMGVIATLPNATMAGLTQLSQRNAAELRAYIFMNKQLFSHLGGVYGQAGLVSTFLAGALSGGTPELTNQQPARLPLAPASTSATNRREIHVTADLAGVDPHMQRMVLNTMLEIERNRSG